MVFKKVGSKKKVGPGKYKQSYRPYEEFPPLDPKDQKLIDMLWKYNRFKYQRGIINKLIKDYELSEADQLKKIAEGIDLAKVGFLTSSEKKNELVKFVCAQAMRDNITNDLRGLVIRDLIPDIDFRSPVPQGDVTLEDDFKLPLSKRPPREWRQPAWGYYEKGDDDVIVYNGGYFERRRVIAITGFNNLNDRRTHISDIKIKRALVLTLDERAVGPLDDNKEIELPTAALFKAGDRIVIVFHTKHDAANMFDNIEVRGIVAEPLGITMTG